MTEQVKEPTVSNPVETIINNELRNAIEIDAVKVFVSRMIDFNHFDGYNLRFIEQRLCDFIAER